MAQNDDADLDAPGGPSADIPDLRKKEQERKRGGVAWSSSAARSAASAASGAPSGTGLLAKVAALSLAGKVTAGAAVVVLLGGAGLALLGGGAGTPHAGSPFMGSSSVGDIVSSIKIHSAGNDRIGVASKGEIAFESDARAKPEEKKQSQDKPAEAAAAPAPTEAPQEAAAVKDKLAHDMSGAKLSGSAGGQFGGKSIFGGAGNPAAPKFGANAPKFTASGGKLSSMRTRDIKATAGGRSTSRGRTRGALGQLRLAKTLSSRVAGATSAAGTKEAGTNVFELNAGEPGTLTTPGGPSGLGGTPAQLGVGGGGGSGSGAPPQTFPIDPIKNALDQIRSMVDQANDMNDKGDMLIAMGVLCIVIGRILTGTFFGTIAAVAWFLAGAMLMYSGYQQKQEAKKLEDQASQMAADLSKRVGAIESRLVRECLQKAIADHTSLDNCKNVEQEERLRLAEERKKRDQERLKEISGETPPSP